MSTKQALDELLANLPEEQMREVLDFARFLHARSEQEEWRRFGVRQLARAYGPQEPEYTKADIKEEIHSTESLLSKQTPLKLSSHPIGHREPAHGFRCFQ